MRIVLVIPVLYFHGFASSPGSRKVQSLRALLAPEGIELNAPDLNIPTFASLDFDAIVRWGAEGRVRVLASGRRRRPGR